MSASLAIAMWAVMGGLWRRMDGGWLGLPKSICIALGGVMASPPIYLAFLSVFGWWPEAAAMTIMIVILIMLFFIASLHPGPSFTNMEVFKKYAIFGLGYWLARLWWPDSWRVGGFIDGPYAIGEIFLGASTYAALMAACLAVM
ncbi:hypothetical protein CU669_15045 [Paramagnetospirillum kuznetsovii]|uniref:Uncharacterized protein n=1 Tax=Paramagnetospirillum kuznetsovii TaxID=2053833 RepID=A0A364NVG1_9PROT|nr:hypothetical protein [Paramagnetospirillum kuznetsovii]RAU21071.1 hypothetical protein CU669_15045 [Paramagnetospirillum kuznetsovii]